MSDENSLENMIRREAIRRLGGQYTKGWNPTVLFDDIMSPIARTLAFFLSTIKDDETRMQVLATTFQYIADETEKLNQSRAMGERISTIDATKLN